MNYCVYLLTFPNNKKYVGITNNFERRMSQHEHTSKIKKSKVYCAIKKYGWETIIKEIILDNVTKEEIEQKEIELIAQFDSIKNGYNLKEGGNLGKHNLLSIEKIKKYQSSPEVVKRKSEISKETMKSEERRKMASKFLIENNKSQKHSDMVKDRWKTDKEYRDKMINNMNYRLKDMVEKSHTPEAIEKRKQTIKKRVESGELVLKGKEPYKKVICLDTNTIYTSVRECAKLTGLTEKGIRRCVTKERKSYKNFHFEYYEVL